MVPIRPDGLQDGADITRVRLFLHFLAEGDDVVDRRFSLHRRSSLSSSSSTAADRLG